ncbi:hypothetical protein ACWC0C_46075 [Streptomyces sp. NPDC001709]
MNHLDCDGCGLCAELRRNLDELDAWGYRVGSAALTSEAMGDARRGGGRQASALRLDLGTAAPTVLAVDQRP